MNDALRWYNVKALASTRHRLTLQRTRKENSLSHYVEVSYSDEQGSMSLDLTLIDLAYKYYGSASGRSDSGDRRSREYLFPHFEQASGFMADVRAYFPQVAVDRVA